MSSGLESRNAVEKPRNLDYLCNRIWMDEFTENFNKKCRGLAETCTEAANIVSEIGLE